MESTNSACGHCGQQASKRCGSCKNVQYCSLECQQADWAWHKLLCKSFASFSLRPKVSTRRAIFLPEDEDKPRFLWLPVKALEDRHGQCERLSTLYKNLSKEELDYGVPDMEPGAQAYMPTKHNPIGKWEVDSRTLLMVCGKLGRGELLDHSIVMMAPRNGHKHERNKCLQRFANEAGEQIDPLLHRGPLIFIGMNKVRLPKYVVDLDTNDLTLAVDAAVGGRLPGFIPPHAGKVQAVRLDFLPSPSFEYLDIPKRHPVFKSAITSAVAKLLSASIKIWHYSSSNKAVRNPQDASDTTSAPRSDPKILQTCMDVSSPDFGRIPAAVEADNRSMLIASTPRNLLCAFKMDRIDQLLQALHDHVVPTLSDVRNGTPEERQRKVDTMAATVNKTAKDIFMTFMEQSGRVPPQLVQLLGSHEKIADEFEKYVLRETAGEEGD